VESEVHYQQGGFEGEGDAWLLTDSGGEGENKKEGFITRVDHKKDTLEKGEKRNAMGRTYESPSLRTGGIEQLDSIQGLQNENIHVRRQIPKGFWTEGEDLVVSSCGFEQLQERMSVKLKGGCKSEKGREKRNCRNPGR